MGMDISGINPTIIGEEPKFPDNFDKLSDKARKCYWELDKEFHNNNPGVYFRANIWSWRPIQLACIMAVQELDIDVDTDNWGYNDGGGLKNPEDCRMLAKGLENMVGQMRDEGLNSIGFNMGTWSVKSKDGKGYTLSPINEKDEPILEEMYPNGSLVKQIPIEVNGTEYFPSHVTELEHFDEFIQFLKHCNGFEIW